MKKLIIIAVVIVVAAAAVYWLFIKKPGTTILPFGQKAGDKTTESETMSGLGGQLFDQVQQNPGEKLPETNPFNNDLNPFKDAYVNPFE